MKKFNSYMDCSAMSFWKNLCEGEGTLRHYEPGEYFFLEGEVAKYLGYIVSGTLKYIACSSDGTEYVMGLEFTNEFVSDFPFSIRGMKARTSVIASSPCDILCVPTQSIRDMLEGDSGAELREIMMLSTEAVFGTVYDRYKDMYILTPQQRYNKLLSDHPDLFAMFPLRDIASYLRITPTHLSRLRKNVGGE